jgi:uncharacterized secreted protein with C-terminal beta-propeller domain
MKSRKLKLSGLMLAGLIIIVSFVYAVNIQPAVTGFNNFNTMVNQNPLNEDIGSYGYDLKKFSTYVEFTEFLNNRTLAENSYGYYWGKGVSVPLDMGISVDTEGATSENELIDYSNTNIQVDGVDEPDFVKTDGKYIFMVSGQKLFIILANPVEDAKIVTNISFDFSINGIFLNENRLIVFSNSYGNSNIIEEEIGLPAPWYDSSNTVIQVYDIIDRKSPLLKRDIVIGGNYFNARMIGDYVYIITKQYKNSIQSYTDDGVIIPTIAVDGEVKKIPIEDIYCIDIPSNSYTITHVISVNIKNEKEDVVDKIFTLGTSNSMYVSMGNIYITYQINYNDYKIMEKITNEVVIPILPDNIRDNIETVKGFDITESQKQQVIQWILDGYYKTIDRTLRNNIESEINRRLYRTIIHKISVNYGQIQYKCNGSVPGYVLNQFSMDENNGFLRIATQIDGWWSEKIEQSTNLYILDESLKLISSVENIASGEQMHSARFMGNKAYLVTFKKVDPFFTIDLSNPLNPKIMGELKIPGYSDYLHPFDENHIIGVGKDTVESENGLNAWYQGLKIAIFDVSDFDNPKELSKVIIGDRGTNSPALYDHKAFLFNKEKELLVIPVSLFEIDDKIKEDIYLDTGSIFGEFKYQGAFVYKLTLDNGFELKGHISHKNNWDNSNNYYWSYGSSYDVKRSLYIDNVLYTISDSMIKMNSLNDLSELNKVILS